MSEVFHSTDSCQSGALGNFIGVVAFTIDSNLLQISIAE